MSVDLRKLIISFLHWSDHFQRFHVENEHRVQNGKSHLIVSSAARIRPKRPWPSPKSTDRFFAGALYQFQLFENKGKEQSDVRQVTEPSRTKFLAAPLFIATFFARVRGTQCASRFEFDKQDL